MALVKKNHMSLHRALNAALPYRFCYVKTANFLPCLSYTCNFPRALYSGEVKPNAPAQVPGTSGEPQMYRAANISVLDPLSDYRMRLLYRSTKNGILENDIILGDFARANIATLSAKQLQEFEDLLCENDWDIYHWCVKPAAEAKMPDVWQQSEIIPLLRRFVDSVRAKIF